MHLWFRSHLLIVPNLLYLTHQLDNNILLKTISLYPFPSLAAIASIFSGLHLDLILPCQDEMISIMVNAFIIIGTHRMLNIASLPPYDQILWTDGSVSFPFGKVGSGVLANCSLSGTEATLFFSAGPVCSSFSSDACTILQALCWSRQQQQVCHFSFLLSDSRSVLPSICPFTSISLANLAETVFSFLLYHQFSMGPRTLIFPGKRCGQ